MIDVHKAFIFDLDFQDSRITRILRYLIAGYRLLLNKYSSPASHRNGPACMNLSNTNATKPLRHKVSRSEKFINTSYTNY